MKQRQRLALLLAACVLFFGRQILAGQEVTFEILTRFDYPGGSNTFASGINDRGEVVGSFVNEELNRGEGFIRFADGTIDWPIKAPGFANTDMFDIDDKGRVVGFVVNPDTNTQGFLLRPGHRFAFFSYPGASSTEFLGINNRGQICATFGDANASHGFVVRVREGN
jgi:uncharacterized membrane protein